MNSLHNPAFRLTVLAAALLAVFGPARAEDADEVKQLTTPTSEASLGVGYVSSGNQQWGKYTGMTEPGFYLLMDFDAVSRNDETGMWLRFLGRNVGLEDRELRFEQSVQGNWGYFIDYNQIPFNQPLTVITRTSGIGTPLQNPAGLPFLVPVDLETRRDIFTVGFNKFLGEGFDFNVRFRNENKDGNRRWGRQNPDFLAEPIDWQTNQLDAVVGYTGEKFQFLLGYYGTNFNNANTAVTVVGGGNSPMSLPPDNESHQAYLSGAYNFTPTTRGNFKVSYTQYTQNEAFFTPTNNPPITPATSLAAIGVGSLNGKVDTTLAEVGITSRPIPKLWLRADWRYEDRNDETPRLQYVSGAGSRDGFNVPLSRTTNIFRGEAQYQLPMGFRAIGNISYDQRDRVVTPTLRQVSWREHTDETAYLAELRRSLSETLNGSLSYRYADRHGSVYLPANNNVDPDIIDPIHWADRTADRIRLKLDWAPSDPLSVQFIADYGTVDYPDRLGAQNGEVQFYSLDGTYLISDKWQVNGWVSYTDTNFDQADIGQAATGAPPSSALTARQLWSSNLVQTTTAVGLGLRGKPMAKIEIGADLQYQEDKSEFNLLASSGPLPEITVKHTTLTLYGTYAVKPNSGVKLQYIYDRYTTNDWAWQINPFPFFTNGTVLFMESPQTVNFVGVSYYYNWQ